MLTGEYSFVDRDMVMRHYGGGIGHYVPRAVEDSSVPEEGEIPPGGEGGAEEDMAAPSSRGQEGIAEDDEGGRSDEEDFEFEMYGSENESGDDSSTDDEDDDGHYASD